MTSRNRKLNMPLWGIVSELCGVGSTSAHEICRDNGLNPSAPATDELPEAMMPSGSGVEQPETLNAGSLDAMVSIVRQELERYENMINRGKGEWPREGYVRDSTWDGWMSARHALRTTLRKMEDANVDIQNSFTKDKPSA
jgi:hypothetical protein